MSDTPAPKPEAAKKRKAIIGRNLQYIPPPAEKWTGTAVGYRPKKPKRRPVLQPNPV